MGSSILVDDIHSNSVSDIDAAKAFYYTLDQSQDLKIWDELYIYLAQDRRFFNIVDHYLKSQYDLDIIGPTEHLQKKWLTSWHIAGCPKKFNPHVLDTFAPQGYRNMRYVAYYIDPIMEVRRVIEDWMTLGGATVFPPIVIDEPITEESTAMKLIDLDELESRVKAIKRPTPHQVLNLITVMNRELNSKHYQHTSSIGLGTIEEGLYAKA